MLLYGHALLYRHALLYDVLRCLKFRQRKSIANSKWKFSLSCSRSAFVSDPTAVATCWQWDVMPVQKSQSQSDPRLRCEIQNEKRYFLFDMNDQFSTIWKSSVDWLSKKNSKSLVCERQRYWQSSGEMKSVRSTSTGAWRLKRNWRFIFVVLPLVAGGVRPTRNSK